MIKTKTKHKILRNIPSKSLQKKITFESKLIISIFLKTSFYLGIAHEAKSQSQFAALFFKMFKKIIVYLLLPPI
jgi:hypothetical protein